MLTMKEILIIICTVKFLQYDSLKLKYKECESICTCFQVWKENYNSIITNYKVNNLQKWEKFVKRKLWNIYAR